VRGQNYSSQHGLGLIVFVDPKKRLISLKTIRLTPFLKIFPIHYWGHSPITVMKSPWSLRDYVFAAFMTIGMVASVFAVGPLAPPFMELVVWAPFGGIFLTLGMARLQKRGSVALMILPLAILLVAISPVITLYLGLTVLVTEAVIFFRGNYRTKGNRLLGNVVFFVSALVIGLVSAGLLLGDKFGELLTQPWLLGGLAIAAGLTGSLGWWLGEKIVQQLRRAGKLDTGD
jgi:hypothetical protein